MLNMKCLFINKMSIFSFTMFKTMRVGILGFILLTTSTQYSSCKQNKISRSVLGYSSQLFAADLFMKLDAGNQLFSPVIIQSGLSLLPCQGLAKSQLINALHLSSSDYWIKSYKDFITSAYRTKTIDIKPASAIFVKDKLHFLNSYKKLFKTYGTILQTVDFSKPEVVAKQINRWVENKTNKKIQNIVDVSSLTSSTAALLITALYFNANWETPFEKEATHSGVFYSNGIREDKTDMMLQTSEFNYVENKELNAKFLELPYVNQDYKMTIVLPNQRDGLPALESQIGKIFDTQNVTSVRTTVTIPKFKFENKVELTDALKKLGITSIFDDGISFGNSNSEKLQINNIVQKTYVDVNEIGTEAAAVMEIEMSARFGFQEMEYFNAEHPFLFFIRQESSGVILFLGRFTNPE